MFDYEYYDGMKISVLFDESKTFYKKRDFNTQVRSELHLSYMKKLEQEAKDGVKEGTFNITRERVLNGYRVHYERIYGK